MDFLRDAYPHLKGIAHLPTVAPLFAKGGLQDAAKAGDAGLIVLQTASVEDVVAAASAGRVWAREPSVRPPPPLR